MTNVLALKFGELEAVLADLNDIPSQGRTAFAARLKNYHRLGFPKGIGGGRGKAVIYGVGELVQMAVVVEMTQLGLTPERAIHVYEADEYPVLMAVTHAARALVGVNPDNTFHPEQGLYEEGLNPASMFLYFDPAVLSPYAAENEEDLASATFFYAGEGVVRENLTQWTTRQTRRLSLINVTALLWDLGRWINDADRDNFFKQISDWAEWLLYRTDFDLDQWLMGPVHRLMTDQAANPVHPLHLKAPAEWLTLPGLVKDAGFEGKTVKTFDLDHPLTPEEIMLVEMPEQHPNWRSRAIKDQPPQPDLIINLPGQRQLFVDAKVIPAVDTPSAVINSRIEELLEHPYAGQFTDRTKYIVLYLPSDSFFTDAIREDKRLWEWAFEQQIVIATPSTMIRILRAAEAAHAAALHWHAADEDKRSRTLTEGVIAWQP